MVPPVGGAAAGEGGRAGPGDGGPIMLLAVLVSLALVASVALMLLVGR
jgi:hypothetical protein